MYEYFFSSQQLIIYLPKDRNTPYTFRIRKGRVRLE